MEYLSDRFTKKWQKFIKSNESGIVSAIHKTKDLELMVQSLFVNISLEEIHRKFLQPCMNSVSKKCNDLSIQFRTKGNHFYSQKNYNYARQNYDKAVQLANHHDDVFSMALANRSALFYETKEYELCLIDITNALTCKYNSPHKMLARRGQCYFYLKKYNDAKMAFNEALLNLQKSNYPNKTVESAIEEIEKWMKKIPNIEPNLQENMEINNISSMLENTNIEMPSASQSIKASFLEEKGRFILASEELKAGEIIFKEKSFAFILLPNYYMSYCYHCLEKLKTIFPCRSCNHIGFCSAACENKAWSKYHYIECKFQDVLYAIGIAHLSLKIVLVAGLTFLIDTRDKLKKLDLKKMSFENDYFQVYSLLTHHEHMHVNDLAAYALTSILLLECLKQTNYFAAINQKDLDFDVYAFTGSLLLRHICQLVCNAHAITEVESFVDDEATTVLTSEQEVRIATAIFPTTSLMNHSCQPNIISCFEKDVLTVRVTKDVALGEEIYNCYGPHYLRMCKLDRQQSLKEQYFFECKCHPCLHGPDDLKIFKCNKCSGPIYQHSGVYKCAECKANYSNVNNFIDEALKAQYLFDLAEKQLQSTNISEALQFFIQCEKLRCQIFYKWSKELAEALDSMAQCYAILGNFLASYNCLKKSTNIIKMHYGPSSIELANELRKLIDVCVEAKKTEERTDVKYAEEVEEANGCQGNERKSVEYAEEVSKYAEEAARIFAVYYGSDCHQIGELQVFYNT